MFKIVVLTVLEIWGCRIFYVVGMGVRGKSLSFTMKSQYKILKYQEETTQLKTSM